MITGKKMRMNPKIPFLYLTAFYAMATWDAALGCWMMAVLSGLFPPVREWRHER